MKNTVSVNKAAGVILHRLYFISGKNKRSKVTSTLIFVIIKNKNPLENRIFKQIAARENQGSGEKL